MSQPKRIIIDTDPGVDDILAILLALAAQPDEVEVLLLSVTFGNIDVEACLRNVVSMFHVIDKELKWRRQMGAVEGFGSLKKFRPLVAVGPEKPLEDQLMMADYFHGSDGLGEIHSSHPHFTPEETWRMLFKPPTSKASAAEVASAQDLEHPTDLFIPSHTPADEEILRLLRENEPDTVSIVAIGPLTNLAIAASKDPETFLRVKEVIVMGGAIDTSGNITPLAEFNICADAVAAARIFALTSPSPSLTLPPRPPPSKDHPGADGLPDYPSALSRTLNLSLFSLDITKTHLLTRDMFEAKVEHLLRAKSPLAEWMKAFLDPTFQKMESLHERPPSLELHDPLCIWYILTHSHPSWLPSPRSPEDIRIETAGQWTRGMCVFDRRTRRRAKELDEVVPGDGQGWLSKGKGNRIRRIVRTPGEEAFAVELLERIFGVGPR